MSDLIITAMWIIIIYSFGVVMGVIVALEQAERKYLEREARNLLEPAVYVVGKATRRLGDESSRKLGASRRDARSDREPLPTGWGVDPLLDRTQDGNGSTEQATISPVERAREIRIYSRDRSEFRRFQRTSTGWSEVNS